jgi:hypothetical protein
MAVRLFLVLLAFALPVSGADPAKVLRVAFQNAESTFDPALFQDTYSSMVADNIFDSMLRYDYLARPAKLVPNTLATMPEVSSDGMTITFRLKPGIRFTSHVAFNGKPRELVAADYAYSIRRFFDPKVKSPNLYLLEGKIAGLDDMGVRARRQGHFDYDAPVAGLQVPDRYTLRVRLTAPRLHVSPFDGDLAVRRRGARGGRAPRRRRGLAPGGHGTVRARALAPRPQDRARGESRLPRDAGRLGRAVAEDRARRDLRDRGEPAALARVPER